MYTIDKDVPVPTKRGRGRKRKYPEIYVLEVGESIYVKGKKSTSFGSIIKKLAPKKFTCSADAEGVRIWRVQ